MGKKSKASPPQSLDLDIEKGPQCSSFSPRHHRHHKNQYASSPPLPPPPAGPDQWFPWLIPLIFMADIAIFVYTMYVNDCPAREGSRCTLFNPLGRFSFEPFKSNPMLGPSISTLEQLGGLERKLVVDNGESWRLVSCIWLHAGALHLAANMLSLIVVAISLEQEFGFLKIGVLYVLAGIGGSLLSTLSTSNGSSISVGASGALFGLLGAMLSELITNWTIYANKCTALITLVIVVVLNMAIGLLIPHVDNSAHIGGFVAGFLLGFVLLIRPQYGYVSRRYIPAGYDIKRKKSKHRAYQYILWVTALLLIVAGFSTGFAKVLNGQAIKKITF
ncbi:RHOMBOID-like protein 5 [Punica granatum]|uniref:RHOMBOID-like protein n=2 Tax=Punica granatum TaxID=22663 RepID=A0A218XA69_PUNGR|nr:RHOMBOID-like protein 5 [Punica granatum]OWM81833.1 hypothetical protein CDL15_Pgr007871 [Punica granatum]PKI48500.1 hypothetical protein CRG98_031122 [Punica granatum]